jgi:hypothetical protein
MNSLNANNKMYEGYEETGNSLTSVDKASESHKIERYEEKNIKTLEECEIRIFCATTYEAKSGMDKQYIRNDWMKKLYVAMKKEVQLTHFSVLIIKKTNFDAYARASIGTSVQGWYEWIYNLKGTEQNLFDSICQKLLSYVYLAYEFSLAS